MPLGILLIEHRLEKARNQVQIDKLNLQIYMSRMVTHQKAIIFLAKSRFFSSYFRKIVTNSLTFHNIFQIFNQRQNESITNYLSTGKLLLVVLCILITGSLKSEQWGKRTTNKLYSSNRNKLCNM